MSIPTVGRERQEQRFGGHYILEEESGRFWLLAEENDEKDLGHLFRRLGRGGDRDEPQALPLRSRWK